MSENQTQPQSPFLIDDDGFAIFEFNTAEGVKPIRFDVYEVVREIEARIPDDIRNEEGKVMLDDFGSIVKAYLIEKHGLELSSRAAIQFGELLYAEQNRLVGFTNPTQG